MGAVSDPRACANMTEMEAPRPSKSSRLEEKNPTAGDDSTTEDGAKSVRRTTGAEPESLGEEGDGGEGSGEEDEEDEGVREQMNEFFSELDVDLTRQKRNLMTEGIRVRCPTLQTVTFHAQGMICSGSETKECLASSPPLGDGFGKPATGQGRLSWGH